MFERKRNNTWLVVIVAAAVFLTAVLTVWPSARRFTLMIIEKPLSLFIEEPELPIEDSLAYRLETEARISLLEEENALLKRTQLISGTIKLPSVLGRVLWYDPDPARHAVLISLPEAHRVRTGDAVLAPGNVFVGIVESVGNISANVRLLDDKEFQISAKTENVDGILVGSEDGLLKLTLVPTQNVPTTGSVVRTAGKEGRVPEGLLIGTVSVERSNFGNPFAQLSIVPAAPINTLSAVFVVIIEEL